MTESQALSHCRALKSSIEAIDAIVQDRKRDWQMETTPEMEAAAKNLGFDIGSAKAVFQVFIDGAAAIKPPLPSTPKPAKKKGNDRK